MSRNLLRLALSNLRSRRTRSWLTILGVLIGVAAVTALISIGTGIQRAVLSQFEDIGYDIILIVPEGAGAAAGRLGGRLGQLGQTDGGSFSPEGIGQPGGTAAAEQLRDRLAAISSRAAVDVDVLLDDVPTLTEAGALGTQVASVRGASVSGYLRVTTPTQQFLDGFSSVLNGFAIAYGRSFLDLESNEAVLGSRAAQRLGASVGSSIDVSGEAFEVVGILESSGSARDAVEGPSGQGLTREISSSGGVATAAFRGLSNTDDAIFVAGERAETLWPSAQSIDVTFARVESGVSVSETLDSIRVSLATQGASGNPVSIQQIADQIQGTLGMVESVLASIAAVALLVGGVGLMNTMYTAVLERRREIGTLKSIGATDGQVLVLFLIDSGLMGFIGGAIGLAIGAALSMLATRVLGPALGVAGFSPVFEVGLVAAVLGFSLVLGALSGSLPALRAARMNPVEALAEE